MRGKKKHILREKVVNLPSKRNNYAGKEVTFTFSK